MAPESFRASAPGNLMLMGEHAVMRNRHAIVCAVNRRIRIKLTPRDDKELTIRSQIGEYSGALAELEAASPFSFVQAAIIHSRHDLPSGFDLDIQSEFSDTLGFGSSAAVTVAVVGALAAWTGRRTDPYDIFHTSRQIIRSVQDGKGSGSDVAASVFGGVVAYRPEPLHVERLCSTFPISVFYSGRKTPTVEVIKQVEALAERYPDPVRDILTGIGDLSEAAVPCFRNRDFESVGQLMNMNQGLMDALGLCDGSLADIIHQLREQPGILGAKISGAGLGDCAIGLGTSDARLFDYDRIPVEISDQGFSIDD